MSSQPPAKPPRLLLGPLTGRAYIVTAYDETPSGQITAHTKHDASNDLAQIIADAEQRGRVEALRAAADDWDRVHEDPDALAMIEREYRAGGPSAPTIWLRARAALAEGPGPYVVKDEGLGGKGKGVLVTYDLAEAVDAAIRLISPDHITPIGARQIRSVLAGILGEEVAR